MTQSPKALVHSGFASIPGEFVENPSAKTRWTEADDDYLRTWGYMGAWHMAMDLGRSQGSIRQRARGLGVRLDQAACSHQDADTTKEHCHCGAPLWTIHRWTAKWKAEA